jgi:hypothetical protein
MTSVTRIFPIVRALRLRLDTSPSHSHFQTAILRLPPGVPTNPILETSVTASLRASCARSISTLASPDTPFGKLGYRMASAVRGIDTSFQSSLRVQEQRWVSAETTMYKLCVAATRFRSALDRGGFRLSRMAKATGDRAASTERT